MDPKKISKTTNKDDQLASQLAESLPMFKFGVSYYLVLWVRGEERKNLVSCHMK